MATTRRGQIGGRGGDGGAYERLRRAPDENDPASDEIRALRDKVRQLQAENAWLRQQLEGALGDTAVPGGDSAHLPMQPGSRRGAGAVARR